MPFELTIGRPGMGKSMYTAKMVKWALARSEYIYKKGLRMDRDYCKKMLLRYPPSLMKEISYKNGKVFGLIRRVALNFHLSKEMENKYFKFIYYWDDPKQLTRMFDFDLFIDEIATYFPSDKWKDTPREVRRMFGQHRKRGMEIFANTQDYRMVDINCRRMLSRVFQLYKVIGSRNPSATLPQIKHPWGIIAQFELDTETMEDDKEKKRVGLPSFFLITKKLTDMYDTTEDIKPAPPPLLEHEERFCPVPNCKMHTYPKLIHY